jgi:hypothetical protein
MAWIEQHRRADGGLTARVIWRPGGARDATRVWETFGAGSDAQNLARADGFKLSALADSVDQPEQARLTRQLTDARQRYSSAWVMLRHS